MKKTFGFFAIAWVIVFAIFNVIVFASPNEAAGMSKFGGAFWAGYIFITLALIGQFINAYFAFKADSNQKMFYNISLLKICYTGLVFMFIFGTACMAIPNLPNWIGIILCMLVLAFTVFAVLKASVAISAVNEIDQRVKVKTLFIKSLTADAENLMNVAKTAELKALAKKVYEAARYSDPMPDAVLIEIEDKIQKAFSVFENAVNEGNAELAPSAVDEVLSLIDLRNKKCKLLK